MVILWNQKFCENIKPIRIVFQFESIRIAFCRIPIELYSIESDSSSIRLDFNFTDHHFHVSCGLTKIIRRRIIALSLFSLVTGCEACMEARDVSTHLRSRSSCKNVPPLFISISPSSTLVCLRHATSN